MRPGNKTINSTKLGSARYHSQISSPLVWGALETKSSILRSQEAWVATRKITFPSVGGALVTKYVNPTNLARRRRKFFVILCFRNTISIKKSNSFRLKIPKFSPPARFSIGEFSQQPPLVIRRSEILFQSFRRRRKFWYFEFESIGFLNRNRVSEA